MSSKVKFSIVQVFTVLLHTDRTALFEL